MTPNFLPRGTYRLQFHDKFTFTDALALVPYLDSLGISHVYASPFFRSAAGSVHGYDVCDHNQFDPEIGTAADFERLSAALAEREMSILLDFVPNHMGISGSENRWWADVLENGAISPYAKYFDIDWKPLKKELENQVLLPILGDQYGKVLESGELKIIWLDGTLLVDYVGNRLPLSPQSIVSLLEQAVAQAGFAAAETKSLLEELDATYRHAGSSDLRQRRAMRQHLSDLGKEGEPFQKAITSLTEEINGDFDRLDELLSRQNYRLSFWKVATQEINYRRFFDVNTLAALRMEEDEVFTDVHRLLLELIAKKAVSGVRIDHIDGLALPRIYLEKLQAAMAEALGEKITPENPCAAWLLVEKILGDTEQMPTIWPVHGTTGYEFAGELTGLQIDPAAEKIISTGYIALTGQSLSFAEQIYRGKSLVMVESLAAEINTLGYLLNQISECHRWYRDFTLNALTAAVRELIACFSVYRSYLEPGTPISETDRRLVLKSIAVARRRNPEMDRTVFEFLRDILIPPPENPHPIDEALRDKFVLKFQQCTSPVMAKGVEDTAFYIYNRFIALNEVGSDPGRFGLSVENFHQRNQQRQTVSPLILLATSTHDTKRSEDVRARLAVLSEIPGDWIAAMIRWKGLNLQHKVVSEEEVIPDENEEFLLYQILLGSWPLEPMSDEEKAVYIERIQQYMVKALHEAKVNSSWVDPNETWDNGTGTFIATILDRDKSPVFLADFEAFIEKIALPGIFNSLAQTVLKLTCPGVPDFYQGSEVWDWSLVDPDNRRPVDYAARFALLEKAKSAVDLPEMIANWRSGLIKIFVIDRVQELRRQHPLLFKEGNYRALTVSGPRADCVVAFERSLGTQKIVVVVPRFTMQLGSLPESWNWENTQLEDFPTAGTNLFDASSPVSGKLSDMLGKLPVAVIFYNTTSTP